MRQARLVPELCTYGIILKILICTFCTYIAQSGKTVLMVACESGLLKVVEKVAAMIDDHRKSFEDVDEVNFVLILSYSYIRFVSFYSRFFLIYIFVGL